MSDLDSQSPAFSPPPDQTPGLDQAYQDLVGRRVWLPAADAAAAAKTGQAAGRARRARHQ